MVGDPLAPPAEAEAAPLPRFEPGAGMLRAEVCGIGATGGDRRNSDDDDDDDTVPAPVAPPTMARLLLVLLMLLLVDHPSRWDLESGNEVEYNADLLGLNRSIIRAAPPPPVPPPILSE